MKETQDPTRKLFWQLPAFFLFAVALWWAYRVSIGPLSGETDIAKQGQFGDMFGGLNALVSMMGFVGLFVSLNLQRQQFQASLADMRENAEAAEHQAKAMEAQTRALRNQNRIRVQEMKIARIGAKLNSQSLIYQALAGLDRNHPQLVPVAKEIERLEQCLRKIKVNKLQID